MEVPPELGPFEPTAVLGEGGSGIVYAARWQDRTVALKVARPELPLTTKEQQRFLHEARLMSRVRHPAIVEVLDAGVLPDGRAYLAMTLLDGETLAERLAARGPLPLADAVRLFSDLADAAATLHAEGLVHRDLKPENVMLVDEGRQLKLLDFGIAKDLSAPASTTTQSGLARGTPATMAPERFFGAPASASTDVYELALVLYAMLVGTLPWPDSTNVDVRLNPRSPRDAGADVPEALSTTILRALSTRPERRPASARALAEEVRAALTSTAATAKPDARVTQATPSQAPLPVVDDVPPAEPAPVSSQRAAAGRTSDKTQVKDVAPPAPPAPRRARAALLALAAALATAGAFALARARASTPDAGDAAEARAGLDRAASQSAEVEPTGSGETPHPAAAPPMPSTNATAAPAAPAAEVAPKSATSAAALPAKAGAAPRAAAIDTKGKPAPSAAPIAAPAAAELPGGVYDKPPY